MQHFFPVLMLCADRAVLPYAVGKNHLELLLGLPTL